MSSAGEIRSHPTPPSAGQQELPQAASRPRDSLRRDKPQLSCNLCRRRKLRCDRKQPCSSCSSRGLKCTYLENHAAASTAAAPSTHDRIVQLERLVMSLMDSAPGRTGDSGNGDLATPAAATMNVPSECGSMRVSDSELRYVGGNHWAAILDSITDLKDHLDREENLRLAGGFDRTPDDNGDGVDSPVRVPPSHALLLYGCRRPASRAEILAALPPKVAVDRYISRYFNCLTIASCVVHGPSFLREYEAFWANPSGVPIVWIGFLFSIICLAVVTSYTADPAHGHELEQQLLQIDLYREKIVQCLVVGEYTKPGPYVLEVMIHYLHIEFTSRADALKDTWFLLALAVNLAMRMGYHRDPSHFPGIPPVQCEMRRRLWATVLQADIVISTQMGMPRMISDWQWDTAEPRNLNDADLDRASAQLPSPRPETEHTTALGVIARRRILIAVGTVSDLTAAVRPCSYAEVMRVDGVLHEAAASIPLPLKEKPMAASVTDSPQIIMARLFISHLFFKGQIMLHRRFLYMESPSPDHDSFAYSRKTCLDASISMLQIQRVLDEETCPAGQLFTMRWRLSSIMNNQFLTATMVLCSLLHRGQTLQREDEIVAALHRSRAIWMRSSSKSQEAKKAAETVSFVLARVMGEGRRDGVGLDDEEVDGALKIGGHGMPTILPSLTNGGDAGMGFDGQRMFQDVANLDDPSKFIMPGLLGIFTPPNQQSQSSTFNMEAMEPSTATDGWMFTNESDTDWQ